MKKIFFLLLILASAIPAKACDICGCGVGGNYIGILPDFNKKILGLRYRYNSLRSHIGTTGNSTYLTTKELFHTAEWWGGWNISKKWRVMAILPFSFAEKTNQGSSKQKNGMGDVAVSGFYQLMNKKTTAGHSKLLLQNLWVGGGVKLPSGKYNPADKINSSQNSNLFQLGTGSTDFTLNAMYDIRLQDIGFNLNSSYKINTANKYNYRYGNRLSISTQLYHKFSIGKKSNVAPNAGILFERSQKDMENNLQLHASGGKITMGSIGAEVSYKKIMFGLNWQTPLSQDLASGIVKAGNKAMVHAAFAF